MLDLSPIPHLVIQCAIHRHSRKVTHDFQNELGRTLPGRDDIHPVLGPRQGHIKKAAFLGILHRTVLLHDISQHRVVLHLGREAIQFVTGVDENDIIITQSLGTVDGHELQTR